MNQSFPTMHRCLTILCLFIHSGLFSQVSLPGKNQENIWEKGTPLITHYSPEEYKARQQNWDITQDGQGIMYFGNNDGLLVYDGVNWELVSLPNLDVVRSLAYDKINNKLYVGGRGTLGYLSSDSLGRPLFVSLLPFLNKEDIDFLDVWSTHATPEGVYFVCENVLFFWSEGKFKTLKTEGRMRAFLVNERVLVKIQNVGIMEVKNGRFHFVTGSDFFKDKRIFAIFPYPQQELLIGTRDHGFYILGENIRPFTTPVSPLLSAKSPYMGIMLADSSFAIGTLKDGVIIMDPSGRKRLALNESKGLLSSIVYGLFQDKSGMIWLAMNEGLAKIEYPSPFTLFRKNEGLKERVRAIASYKGKLYAGTEKGLYVIHSNKTGNELFEPLAEPKQWVWGLLSTNEGLLIATDHNIYRWNERSFKTIARYSINTLQPSKKDSNRVILGLADGLASIYFQNGKWQDEGRVKGIYQAIYHVRETDNGDLWLETNINAIYRLTFNQPNANFAEPVITAFDTADGLPNDVGMLYLIDNQIFFDPVIHSNSLFRFNDATSRFVVDNTLRSKLNLPEGKIEIHDVDPQGNIWFEYTDENDEEINKVAWKVQNDRSGYRIKDLGEGRIADLMKETRFFDVKDSLVWHAGKTGLILHNLRQKEVQDAHFISFIRKVTYKSDSLLFGGMLFPQNTRFKHPVIPFQGNIFRFNYAATGYHNESANQYQTYLEGFDKGWSEWSTESQRDFTNLFEGNYTFHVRAKNIYGAISKEDSFSFSITPPLHRTWWAYVLYGLVFGGMVVLFIHWRAAKHKKEKNVLEAIISERTGLLAKQTEQLKELDMQKSRFFANISHEFRTPLTLIKGPADQAMLVGEGVIRKDDTRVIRENANRLLRLVNQLLDLSKLEAGKLKLLPQKGDVYEFLRAVAAAFSSHAARHRIAYSIEIPEQKLETLFDPDTLEKIINNLLSNAFKFTQDGRTVIFKARHDENMLHLTVTDTGRGMEPNQVHAIFDRFYQVEDTHTKTREGAGIGLALTKELVELMKGKIEVESLYGKGTTFIARLPIVAVPIGDDQTLTKEPIHKGNYRLGAHIPSESGDFILTQKMTATQHGAAEMPLVLIVEDHPDMRRFIGTHLRQHYRLIEAANGAVGLQTAREEIPDLIITDLMMPEMDGMSFCHAIKTDERTSHIPVIMLTAKAAKEDKLEGLVTGADAFLTKPFDTEELKVSVSTLIELRKQLRQKYRKEALIHPEEIAITGMDEIFLKKLHHLLEENLSSGEFGVPQLQVAMALSKTQLHRKIKALTNEAPGEFLRNYRLRRAAQMLEAHSDTVTRIAYATGFNSLSYFARSFKELYGRSPSEYGTKE